MLVVTNIYHIHHKVYTRLFLLTHFRDYLAGLVAVARTAMHAGRPGSWPI